MAQPEGNAGGVARATVAAGTVLGDTYELLRMIGQGGMGTVWEASHLRLPGKRVAVKLLIASVGANSEAYARFRREAEIASRLGHPNIVEVLDFNVAPSGAPYLVLELLHGQNLAVRLQKGPLPPGEALPIARQIGAALAAAHQAGIVHRDLKPENVYLCPPTDEGATVARVKVLDFGISKITGSSTVHTQEQRVMGTPQYMAPEQAKGQNSTIDARSDVFALGAIVYEMLSGRAAFAGENLAEVVFRVVYEAPAPLAALVPGAPASVIAAVERALEKEPAARWPDVSSMIAALTGRPLATIDRGLPLASGTAPNHSDDAFAHTVGSQDGVQEAAHAAAPLAASSPPVANQRGYSTTAHAASADLPGPRESPTVPALPRAPRDGQPARAPRAGRRSAGIAVLFAGVAGLGWYLGRGRGQAPAAAVAVVADAASAPAPIVAPASPPDAAPVVAEAPPDAATPSLPPPPRTPRPQPVNATRGAEEDGDPVEDEGSARTFLDEAATHLDAGDAREALRLARRSLNERSTRRAYSILARAYCALGDLGNARAQLVHLPMREKRRVMRVCAKAGIDLTP